MASAKSFVLASTRIVTADAVVAGHIIVEDGRIAAVNAGHPSEKDVIDVGDDLVLPGFIDLHIHGAGGWDVGTDSASILNMAKILADNGTTAFYPTPATSQLEDFIANLGAVKKAAEEQEKLMDAGEETGAEILGLHLEGPFLNKEKKGAMPEQYLLAPDVRLLDQFEGQAPGLIRRITIAPELPGSLQLIAEMHERGYTIACGHTAAKAELMEKGIEAGITIANHLYNAMSPLHHREPGAVGVCLADDRVICELIADGIHVHPLAIEIALRCKGPENLFLISDAVMAAGLPAGEYEFIGRKIKIDDRGVSRLPDGTIAGSTCLLPMGFRTIAETMGHGPILASRLTATNPARIAGVGERKGLLEAGRDADITVLSRKLKVTHCCVKGVWHKTPTKSASHLVRTAL